MNAPLPDICWCGRPIRHRGMHRRGLRTRSGLSFYECTRIEVERLVRRRREIVQKMSELETEAIRCDLVRGQLTKYMDGVQHSLPHPEKTGKTSPAEPPVGGPVQSTGAVAAVPVGDPPEETSK